MGGHEVIMRWSINVTNRLEWLRRLKFQSSIHWSPPLSICIEVPGQLIATYLLLAKRFACGPTWWRVSLSKYEAALGGSDMSAVCAPSAMWHTSILRTMFTTVQCILCMYWSLCYVGSQFQKIISQKICYFKDGFPKVGSNVQSVSNMASIASQREAGTWMQAFGWDVDKWWSYG